MNRKNIQQEETAQLLEAQQEEQEETVKPQILEEQEEAVKPQILEEQEETVKPQILEEQKLKQQQEQQMITQTKQEQDAAPLQNAPPQGASKPNIWKDGLYLFWVSFVMGLTVFGGGYAMLPVLERAFAIKKQFVSKEDMLDILALSQSVPGLISVNAIIMIGYRRAGIFGAFMGVLGLAIPSLVIICLVTIAYTQFITNKYIGFALIGIRAGVIGLLVSAIWSLSSKGIVDKVTFGIAVGALALAIIMEFKVLNVHPIIIILSGLVVGFTAKTIDNYIKGKKSKPSSGNKEGDK